LLAASTNQAGKPFWDRGSRVVARDSAITFLARVLGSVSGVIANIILARWLGAAGVGEWAVMLAFLMLSVQIFGPGIAMANVYHVARRRYSVGEIWAATVLVGLCCGMLAVLVGAGLVLAGFKSLATIEDKRLVIVLLLTVPFIFISAWGTRIIQGLAKIGLMNLLDLFTVVTTLVLLVVFVVILKMGLWGAVLAYLGSRVASACAVAVVVRRFMRPGECRLSRDSVLAGLRYGMKMYVGKLSNWANNRLDLLIAPLFLDNVQIGLYAVAVVLTEKLWLISDSMSQAVLPRIAADPQGRPQLTMRACRAALMITLPAAGLLAATGWWLFPVLFGPEFRGSYLPMVAILPGTVGFGLSRILAASLAGTNRPGTLSAVISAAAACNVALNFLLIPRFGVVGCSLASTGSYLVQALVLAICYCRQHRVNFGSLFLVEFEDVRLVWEQGSRLLGLAFAGVRVRTGRSGHR